MLLAPTLLVAALLAGAALQETEPDTDVAIGVLVRDLDDPRSLDHAFVRGARIAVDDWNRQGGAAGRSVRLELRERGASAKETRAALAELVALGVTGMLAPLEAESREETVEACAKHGLPVVAIATDGEAELALLEEILVDKFRTPRIGLLSDRSKTTKALQKSLEQRLQEPAALVLVQKIDAKQKALDKAFAKDPPDVLLIDAPPGKVVAALRGELAHTSLPLVLTSRSVGPELGGLERELFVVAGRSASTYAKSTFLELHREEHGEPGLGASEAYELVEVLLRAVDAAGSTDHAAVTAALGAVELEGPRGPVSVTDTGLVQGASGLWRLQGGEAFPQYPDALPLQELSERARSREPDPDIGALFGERRTDVFQLEKDTQWVVVTFDQGEKSTIDDDLAQLGLSTGGKSPVVDRLVKEELLARMLSMMTPKFRRSIDGGPVPGQSLKISFTTQLPPKVKRNKVWFAYIAGDDPGAGGRAYPGQGYCEIYSTHLRKNIFQDHGLNPPINGSDLAYLDGTYAFATDYARDRRGELIRALINSYAGAMCLTGAHEIGHLCGLGHITDDPLGIMNVNEGAGIDPLDGRFSEGSMELLEKGLGVTK